MSLEERRTAANIAKLPELFRKSSPLPGLSRPSSLVSMDCDAVHSALTAAVANRPPMMEACHVEISDVGRPDAAGGDRGGCHEVDATRHRRRDGDAATGLFRLAQRR